MSSIHRNMKTALLFRSALPSLFWVEVAFVTFLALVPSPSIPTAFIFWDKAQHTLAYTALSISGYFAFPKGLKHVFIGLIIHGACIEVIQSTLTTTRFGEPLDVVANSIGVLIGLVAFFATQQN
jgi:VanZ family protein